MAEDWVYIRMKDHGKDVLPGRVSRKAYDDIWSGKGFVIVDDAEAELAGSPATQAEVQAASNAPASEPEAAESATTRKRG